MFLEALFDNISKLTQVKKPLEELLHDGTVSILGQPNRVHGCYLDHRQKWEGLAIFFFFLCFYLEKEQEMTDVSARMMEW